MGLHLKGRWAIRDTMSLHFKGRGAIEGTMGHSR